MFCSFEDVLSFLDELGMFSMDFELDRMRRALASLKVFDGAWHPYIIQVVGTNGKGSTSTFLASLSAAHGVKTGLYTSPHFVTPRERIRINGEMAEPETLIPLANEVYSAAPDLTYFEFLTVLGLLAFRAANVDLVVMEAGLGGRYDATTAVRADAVCFVPIDMDHMKILGSTLQDIAADKSAAIRAGRPALTGLQRPEAMEVLQKTAAEKGSPLLLSTDSALPKGAVLGLVGPHQRDNALLALAAWQVAAAERNWPVREESVLLGLKKAHIPGRFQLIPAHGGEPAFILDGGHNPHGLRSCRTALETGEFHLSAMIFSCLADKDIASMLPTVLAMAEGIPLLLCTIQDNERAIDAEDLAERVRACAAPEGAGPSQILTFPRLAPALEKASSFAAEHGGPVLVCGSLYLLGEIFTLRPQWLEE